MPLSVQIVGRPWEDHRVLAAARVLEGAVNGLLSGVRVLDLSIWRPGPYATQLLAEMGAEVIKVEPPGGDPMRVYVELFASLNADKRSIELGPEVRTRGGPVPSSSRPRPTS